MILPGILYRADNMLLFSDFQENPPLPQLNIYQSVYRKCSRSHDFPNLGTVDSCNEALTQCHAVHTNICAINVVTKALIVLNKLTHKSML
jgi:hypothetical protein